MKSLLETRSRLHQLQQDYKSRYLVLGPRYAVELENP